MTFRGGRQEMTFGAGRLVDVREGPNVRLSFDGERVFYESPALRIDAFGAAPVVVERGVFDDRSIARENVPGKAFWGLYSVIPVGAVPGLHIDLEIILGLLRQNAPDNSGVANERRQTIGTRVWGGAGSLGLRYRRHISIWSLWIRRYPCVVGGFQHRLYHCEPLGGAAAGIASRRRERRRSGRDTQELQSSVSEIRVFHGGLDQCAHQFHRCLPAVTVQPLKNFAFRVGVDVLWRYSVQDAFYQPPGVPLVPGSANKKRFLGLQSNLQTEWQATSHISAPMPPMFTL